MFKSLLKFIPITAILGYFFPKTIASFEAFNENKTPENVIALGEAAADEFAGHFAPNAVPILAHYEEIANPAIESIIVAIESPSIKTIETAAIMTGKALASVLGSKTPPAEIEAAAIAFVSVLNKEIGV